MKTCQKCGLSVGGTTEFCPLCQSQLTGEASRDRYPKVEPEQRRMSLFYKILAFCLLAGAVVCVAVDWMLPGPGHLHWSVMVVLCVVTLLVLLRVMLTKRPNVPRILFQLLIAVSLVVILCDVYTGYTGFSVDLVLPILCSITLVLNFVLAFVQKRYAENGLVYLLMNMLIGVVPYLLLFLRVGRHPLAWVICLVISIITFLGLAVFRGRALFFEMQKRLHM